MNEKKKGSSILKNNELRINSVCKQCKYLPVGVRNGKLCNTSCHSTRASWTRNADSWAPVINNIINIMFYRVNQCDNQCYV